MCAINNMRILVKQNKHVSEIYLLPVITSSSLKLHKTANHNSNDWFLDVFDMCGNMK